MSAKSWDQDKTWKIIEQKCIEVIEQGKNKISAESTIYKDVLFYRGRIALAKELLALPNQEVIIATKRG